MSGGEGLWISRTAPLSNTIRHLHISHNAPYLPPKILHNLCFSFLLDIRAVPREIENNAYAKFGGGEAGGKQGALWELCKWRIAHLSVTVKTRLELTLF